jgi:hypothetical protein
VRELCAMREVLQRDGFENDSRPRPQAMLVSNPSALLAPSQKLRETSRRDWWVSSSEPARTIRKADNGFYMKDTSAILVL